MKVNSKIWTVKFAIAASLLPASLQASSVMGVTGSSGNGSLTARSFYEIDTSPGTAGATTFLGTASVTPNQLAFNADNGNYYYMDHNGSDFYRFDTNTGTETLMADLIVSHNMPAGKDGSGGGDFYNGRYYYTPESGTNSIYELILDPSGTSIIGDTALTPSNLNSFTDLFDGSTNAGFGDFGDIAIDPATGIMYGTSNMTLGGSTYIGFWSVDLNDPNYTMTMIDNNLPDVYQLAFDETGKLWASEWQSGGSLHELNLADGTINQTISVSPAGDFFDLATVVPEPSHSVLCLMGAGMLVLRRKRS